MTLTQLQYLLAVHKYGSFTVAAKSCHVTQPSLSTQIQNLEKELGAPLFDRSKTPVRATEMGKLVIEQARRVLAESERLSELVSARKQELKGEFRLGVIPTIASHLIPLFLGRFSERYPQVELIIEEKPTAILLQELDREEIDAALMAPTQSMPASLVTRTLYYEPFTLFVSQDHPFAKRKQIDPKELSPKGLWLVGESHCLREQTLEVCKGKDSARVLKGVEFRSGSLETIINLIRRSSGYTLLPYLSTLLMSAEERRTWIRYFRRPVPTRKVALISHPNQVKRLVREKLCDEILSVLPQETPRTDTGANVIELK